jgi:FkbM family methyltransferase
MNPSRTFIKKIIYKIFGEKVYSKAYTKGKIKDIQSRKLAEKEVDFIKHFITNESFVLDIGANYGHYAIEMAKLCPNGKVFAYEPIPFTFQILERIKTHFHANNILTFHAAVSETNGTLEMNLPLLDFGAPNTGVAYIGNSSPSKTIRHQVKTVKLDDQKFDRSIDFIKIDIEGHEPQAFKGMEQLILTNRPVSLIEFSHPCLTRANTSPSEFADYLTNQMNLQFFQVRGNCLALVQESTPSDGYYFLIPSEKTAKFHEIICV